MAETMTLEDKIEHAFKFLTFEPAVIQYLSLCELIQVKNKDVTIRINCSGTGSRAIIEYNPEWLDRITDASIIALLLKAEVMRLALHHCTTRIDYPLEILKLASDLIVYEDYAQTVSYEKPEVKDIVKMIPKATDPEYAAIFKKYNFTDEDYFLEHIFAVLKKEMINQMDSTCDSSDSNSVEGESNGESSGSCDGDSSDKKSSGNGKSKDKKDNNDKNDDSSKSDMEKAIDEHFSKSMERAKSACEHWGENEQVDREVEKATRELVERGSSSWGSMSGKLKQLIMLANSPKIDVESIFKHWVGRTISNEHYYTRMKANRRHGWDISGVRRTKKCKVLIAVDTSGSMSDEDVSIGLGFMSQFLKKAEVEYCYWDAECSEFYKAKKKLSEVTVEGRGGTDPQCVFDKIINEKADYDGIILYSDMYFDSETIDRKLAPKIFGIITQEGGTPPIWMRRYLELKDIKEYEKKRNR